MENLIGKSLGRYHVLEQLGEGGMATVYKAYDTNLEREVAVKIIRREAFPPEQSDHLLKRFEREAKALAQLVHPNIVAVIDYGRQEDNPYLVMNYLPGGTLKDKLDKPMPWPAAVHLLIPIAEALNYAHSRNIVHRDVKPSNILLTESGQPMLTDFGIAKILEAGEATQLTATGVGIGTPDYMAPEQWTGTVGPQTDIYSLGVVLYQMVTGRLPFIADTPAAVLIKHVRDPLPRPKSFVHDLPEAVELLLVKALAKEPENRYRDMGVFANALYQLTKSEPTVEVPVAEPAESLQGTVVVAPIPVEPGTAQAEQVAPAARLKDRLIASFTPLRARLGQKKPAPSEGAKVHCPKCSRDVRGNWVSCPYCGANLQAETQATQPISTGTPPIPLTEEEKPRVSRKRPAIKLRGPVGIWIGSGVGLVLLVILAVFLGPRLFHPKPVISASPAHIYMTSNRSGKREIYWTTSVDQSTQVTRTVGGSGSWEPSVGDNGNLYFTSDQAGKAEIFVLTSKGKLIQITRTPGGAESWYPFVDRSGNLYFTSNQTGKAEIFVFTPKGALIQVTRTLGSAESWDPFVDRSGNLYFTSNQTGKAEIFVITSKSALIQVTRTPGSAESWDPFVDRSGNLYFTSNQAGEAEIFAFNPKGGLIQVTRTSGAAASWDPFVDQNGNLFFSSDQSGKVEVFLLTSKAKLIQFSHTPGPAESWIDQLFKRPVHSTY